MAVKRGELIRNAQCIIERTPTATKSEEILSLTADQSCNEAKALPVLICILLYLRLHWCASCRTHIRYHHKHSQILGNTNIIYKK